MNPAAAGFCRFLPPHAGCTVADEPPPIDGLTAIQVHAVAAILSSSSLKDAAEVAGVPYRTLWGWLREPRFAQYLAVSKRMILDSSAGRVVDLVGKALDALEGVLAGDNVPAKVRAAAIVLQTAYNVSSLKDLEAQVLQLRLDREAEAAERAAQLERGREARETPLTPVPDAADAERGPLPAEPGSGPDPDGP